MRKEQQRKKAESDASKTPTDTSNVPSKNSKSAVRKKNKEKPLIETPHLPQDQGPPAQFLNKEPDVKAAKPVIKSISPRI